MKFSEVLTSRFLAIAIASFSLLFSQTNVQKYNCIKSLKMCPQATVSDVDFALLNDLNSPDLPLFKEFPHLVAKIPHVKLAELPTELKKMNKISAYLGSEIYIKCDDLTGGSKNYGGNKVRKLEFLLADALNSGASRILTFGAVGSNFVAATSFYANELGLKCSAFMRPQPKTKAVCNNILFDIKNNCELNLFKNGSERSIGVTKAFVDFAKSGEFPYVIPTGGSNCIGTLGFFNAAFELNKQLKDLNLDIDYIYLAGGSFGTAVGLWVGLSYLKSNIKLKVTYVDDDPFESAQQSILKSAREFIEYLDNLGISIELDKDILLLEQGFQGSQYGASTKEGLKAKELLLKKEDIILDQTYTSKSFAHLLYDIKNNKISKNSKIIFWNTYFPLSDDFIKNCNKNNLPEDFRQFCS